MFAPDQPSLAEGAYWIRNKMHGTIIGIGCPNIYGNVPLVGQDKYPSYQSFTHYSQMWLVEMIPTSNGVYFYIRNSESGNVLDIEGRCTAFGDPVIVSGQKKGDDKQHWKIGRIEDDSSKQTACYCIVNASTNKFLGQTARIDRPLVLSMGGNEHQKHWFFEPVVLPPVYWITHVSTGRHLQYRATKGVTADIMHSSTVFTGAHLWFLESQNDDAYVIRNMEDSSQVLNLSDIDAADGTPVTASTYTGRRNQHWQIEKLDRSDPTVESSNPEKDRINIVSILTRTVIQVTGENQSGTLQAQAREGGFSQSWRLKQYPSPMVFWTSVQNLRSRMFVAQVGCEVVPSRDESHTPDYTIQWRFVADRLEPSHYSIVNRDTGNVLIDREDSNGTLSVMTAEGYEKYSGYLWALVQIGKGIGIVNTTTSRVLGHSANGVMRTHPNHWDEKDDPSFEWNAAEACDRLPSFALVNSRTGRSLTVISGAEREAVSVTTTEGTVNDRCSQWYFEKNSKIRGQVKLANSQHGPIYAIVSKLSGNVLDHYYGKRIEAYSNITAQWSAHRWILAPCTCGERHFQIINVGSGKYLEERETGVPTANSTTPMDHTKNMDGVQCWELVPARYGDFDVVTVEDLPEGTHGKKEIIQNPKLKVDLAPSISAILKNAILDWPLDTVSNAAQSGTIVSVTKLEAERRWNIQIPISLQYNADSAGWIRVDIDTKGTDVNIYGQWLGCRVFDIIVPVDFNIGRRALCEAMHSSLRRQTSAIVYARKTVSPVVQDNQTHYFISALKPLTEVSDNQLTIDITFKNTGDDNIMMDAYDSAGNQVLKDRVIKNRFIIIVKFHLCGTYSFVLKCGRGEKNFSQAFSKAEDIDVDVKFKLN